MLKAYSRARALVNSIRTEEEGATAIEYGLIAGLISVVIIAALILIGTNLDLIFDQIGAAL
jgi:pilus assembly protein Flp/PilA